MEKKIIRLYLRNLLFLVSASVLTAILSFEHSMIFIIINVGISIVIQIIFLYKYNFVMKIIEEGNKSHILISILFAIVMVMNLLQFIDGKILIMVNKINHIILLNNGVNEFLYRWSSWIMVLLALYSIFIYWYVFFNKFSKPIADFINSIVGIEKIYLLITTTVFVLIILIVYSHTNIFYLPFKNGEVMMYDVVYTTDTGYQTTTNIFNLISAGDSDLRQPLFGLFALPFGIIGLIISKLLFFIPNSYTFVIACINGLVLNITIILISRLLKLQGSIKVLFLLSYTFTYPFLLYLFNLEQYVLAFFWLITLCYAYLNDNKHKEVIFIASTGSLLTSGVFIPLLCKMDNIKECIKSLINIMAIFLSLIIITGKLPYLLGIRKFISSYSQFTGINVPFGDRLLQYLNFVASSFIKPMTNIDNTTFGHLSYQLIQINEINILGVIIIVLCGISYIINRKNKFLKMCLFWIIMSFIILCAVGWGTSENGLIIYTLYFSWGFISLIYLLIVRILDKFNYIKKTVLVIIMMILLGINTLGIWDLIQFGIRYYPT